MPNNRAQYEAELLGVTIVEDLKVSVTAAMTNTGKVKHQALDQITSIEEFDVFNGDAPTRLEEEARALVMRVSK